MGDVKQNIGAASVESVKTRKLEAIFAKNAKHSKTNVAWIDDHTDLKCCHQEGFLQTKQGPVFHFG